MRLISALLKLMFALIVLAIPIAGFWMASSMAAWQDGPLWAVIVAGALLFPGLPVLWEFGATWRQRRKKRRAAPSRSFLQDLDKRRSSASLGVFDRLVLRTLAVNVVFIGVVLGAAPRDAAMALATRGDWMLDGVEEPWADRLSFRLLHTADRLGFLVTAGEDNPFADLGEDTKHPGPPAVAPERAAVTLDLPQGAHARIEGWFPPEELTGQATRSLPFGPGVMRVDFDDGRRLSCAFTVTGVETLALEVGDDSHQLRSGPAARGCLQLRAPDPVWRPDLHLMAAHGDTWTNVKTLHGDSHTVQTVPAVQAQEVRAVQIREPYLRVQLSEVGARQLCEATRAHPWQRVVVVVDGVVHGVAPTDTKEQCTGGLSVPLADTPEVPPMPEVGTGQSPWPMSAAPHPAVADASDDDRASIELLGRWIRERAPDPFERTKLLQDIVVGHVVYDDASADTEHRAPQDADTVFRTGTGVCAGYANLMVVLGRAADLEIAYVGGLGRGKDNPDGTPHAWNAVHIGDSWFLIDATWNDGHDDYSADYLFTPPEVFALSHLPKDDGWQLMATPISRGEFSRQPLLRPSFFAADLRLDDPKRSQVTVHDDLQLKLHNPGQVRIRAQFGPQGASTDCTVSGTRDTRVTCAVPLGTHDVRLFHDVGRGTYAYAGAVQVIRR